MQVIEKVKVVPEGYNGAGMNYDGCNRRDVNGKANAGLTLGIIGTALGAWALFGNRRSAGASILGGAGGGMLGDGSTNINVLGATAGSGSGAPTAFQAWEKSCEDTLALQGGLYQWALTQQNQRFEDRERDAIDAEIAPLTQEQQNMLLSNQDYVNNYNALQSMVQAEVLNLVKGKLVSMGESSPAIRLLIPLAKRAITNNINSFDKFLKPIADKDGMIDIEGIFDEEMEIINNIDNFNFDIPFIGGGNISKGIISLEVPYVNKIVALNQTDLEVLKESLISLKTK